MTCLSAPDAELLDASSDREQVHIAFVRAFNAQDYEKADIFREAHRQAIERLRRAAINYARQAPLEARLAAQDDRCLDLGLKQELVR